MSIEEDDIDINDISDEKLENIRAEKRHKDLIILLNKLLIGLEKDNIFTKELTGMFNAFVSNVNEIKKPEIRHIINNDAMISELKQITKVLDEKDKAPMEWKFIVERNSMGYIDSIIAKQKI